MTAETGKPKGGTLARLAALLCQNPEFWKFCDASFSSNDAVCNSNDARSLVLFICAIDSRAELDSNAIAANKFHSAFRIPFSEWVSK
jgi:hypothetical protein